MAKNPAASKNVPAPKPQPEENQDTIEQELERKLEPLLSNVSRVQREQIITSVVKVVRTEAFSGPLPHPRHLREYEDILPGGADRIFRMTEQVIAANIASVNDRVDRDDSYRRLGMHFGFVCFGGIVAAAITVGVYGHVALAIALLASGVISGAVAFIKGNGK